MFDLFRVLSYSFLTFFPWGIERKKEEKRYEIENHWTIAKYH